MKRLLLIALCFVLVATPVTTVAIDLGGDLAAGAAREAGYDPGTTETTFAETLGTVVKTALSLVGIIFLSLMVYAGYLWMTARGEESQIEKAQKMIRGAIIGLIITVGAYSITSFVMPRIVERTAGGASTAQDPPTSCCIRCNVSGLPPGECQLTRAANQDACTQLCSQSQRGSSCVLVTLPASRCQGTRRQ